MEDTIVEKSLENLADEQLLPKGDGTSATSPSAQRRRRRREEEGKKEEERDELSSLRYSRMSYRSMLKNYAEKNTSTATSPPIWAPVMREAERERSRSLMLHSGASQGPDDMSLAKDMDFEVQCMWIH